jgi:hypothetical protein
LTNHIPSLSGDITWATTCIYNLDLILFCFTCIRDSEVVHNRFAVFHILLQVPGKNDFLNWLSHWNFPCLVDHVCILIRHSWHVRWLWPEVSTVKPFELSLTLSVPVSTVVEQRNLPLCASFDCGRNYCNVGITSISNTRWQDTHFYVILRYLTFPSMYKKWGVPTIFFW